jgi:hypothetical protein
LNKSASSRRGDPAMHVSPLKSVGHIPPLSLPLLFLIQHTALLKITMKAGRIQELNEIEFQTHLKNGISQVEFVRVIVNIISYR